MTETARKPDVRSFDLDIDWEKLRAQKQALLALLWGKPDDPIWGIVEMLDAIQDQAVDNHNIDPGLVYGEEPEDREAR